MQFKRFYIIQISPQVHSIVISGQCKNSNTHTKRKNKHKARKKIKCSNVKMLKCVTSRTNISLYSESKCKTQKFCLNFNEKGVKAVDIRSFALQIETFNTEWERKNCAETKIASEKMWQLAKEMKKKEKREIFKLWFSVQWQFLLSQDKGEMWVCMWKDSNIT